MKRILLGQLGSNGDCLYATTLARQIKADYPGCQLTWAISSLCRSVIDNNPYVDAVWEVPLRGWADMNDVWYRFEREAWAQVARGHFDHAFLTQISPANFARYDGTVRPSIFRNYPHPVTVPVESIIELSDNERERVEDWITANSIRAYDQVIVFECSSKSGQSFVTPNMAVEVAERVLKRNPNVCIVLSTHEEVPARKRIISGKALSLRETAALTDEASLFVGCGSGVTVVATSSAAKSDLPNVQILKESSSVYASFRHDLEYFGKPSAHFLETTSDNVDHLAVILSSVLDDGIAKAKECYDRPLPVTFGWYLSLIEQMLIRPKQYVDAAESLLTTAGRYGWTEELVSFGNRWVMPNIDNDARGQYPRGEATRAQFLAEIGTACKKYGTSTPSLAARALPATTTTQGQASRTFGERLLGLRRTIAHWLRSHHPKLYDMLARLERAAWRSWH